MDIDWRARWGRRFWNPSANSLTAWTHVALIVGSLLLLAYFFLSPKIPYNDGFGWDGVRYARWVRSLPEDLASGNIDAYHIKRVLPSFLVSLPARLLGLTITRDYIVYGFCVANAICSYLADLFWLRTCVALRVSGSRALLGLVLLVATYPVTKQSSYNGVLTDLFALAAAAAMLDCWIRDRRLGLAAAVLVSMFCWPSTPVLGSLLLLFPRGSRFSLGRWSRLATWGPWVAGIAFAGACLAGGVAVIALNKDGGFVPMSRAFLPISILIAVAYVFLVTRLILGSISGGVGAPRLVGFSGRRLISWVLLIPCVIVVQRLVAPSAFDESLTTGYIVLGSINRPGLFLVGDFSYYGTLAVLCTLFLPALVRVAANLGFGVLGAVAFALALNLYPESRMTLNMAPLVVLPLVLALPRDRFTGAQWAFVGVWQFATMKVWLPIVATAADFEGLHQRYPAQYLFASDGAFMANDAYVVQGILALVAVAVAGVIFRQPSSPNIL